MRKEICVPMLTLLLLLTACGGADNGEDLRVPYRNMAGCTAVAEVTCGTETEEERFTLWCDYVPEGETRVEILAPESAAGISAVLEGDALTLVCGELCFPAGTVSREAVSPAACIPRLLEALREGWLLETGQERWNEVPCTRLTLDQTGEQGGKLLTSVWLREDGTPLRGELAVDGENILSAEFTEFAFYDKIKIQQTLNHQNAEGDPSYGRRPEENLGGDRP